MLPRFGVDRRKLTACGIGLVCVKMVRMLAALLLLALVAPCAAAEETPEGTADGKQKDAKDEKAKCKDKDPCSEPSAEKGSATNGDADRGGSGSTNPLLDTGERDLNGFEGPAILDDTRDLYNIPDGPGAGGSPLQTFGGPIPSCEPWLVLGSNPQIRPECLAPGDKGDN